MPLNARQAERKEWLESAIEEIQSAILTGISSGVSLSFNSGSTQRSVQRYSSEELSKLEKRFSAELRKLERIEAGTQTRTIRVIG